MYCPGAGACVRRRPAILVDFAGRLLPKDDADDRRRRVVVDEESALGPDFITSEGGGCCCNELVPLVPLPSPSSVAMEMRDDSGMRMPPPAVGIKAPTRETDAKQRTNTARSMCAILLYRR